MRVYMVASICFGYVFPFLFGVLLLKPNLKETGVLIVLAVFLLFYILLFMFNVVGTASIAASDSKSSCLFGFAFAFSLIVSSFFCRSVVRFLFVSLLLSAVRCCLSTSGACAKTGAYKMSLALMVVFWSATGLMVAFLTAVGIFKKCCAQREVAVGVMPATTATVAASASASASASGDANLSGSAAASASAGLLNIHAHSDFFLSPPPIECINNSLDPTVSHFSIRSGARERHPDRLRGGGACRRTRRGQGRARRQRVMETSEQLLPRLDFRPRRPVPRLAPVGASSLLRALSRAHAPGAQPSAATAECTARDESSTAAAVCVAPPSRHRLRTSRGDAQVTVAPSLFFCTLRSRQQTDRLKHRQMPAFYPAHCSQLSSLKRMRAH